MFLTASKMSSSKVLLPKKVKVIAEDELTEISLRQRVRNIENNLFDEYWDELLANKKQTGARG